MVCSLNNMAWMKLTSARWMPKGMGRGWAGYRIEFGGVSLRRLGGCTGGFHLWKWIQLNTYDAPTFQEKGFKNMAWQSALRDPFYLENRTVLFSMVSHKSLEDYFQFPPPFYKSAIISSPGISQHSLMSVFGQNHVTLRRMYWFPCLLRTFG